ncbi:hypothetical protein BU26DRAFT_555820 [Trematosphaeria pertusa]|uniref:BTB domain-containing protein n=1 Tax=Trematosphaeria pertusa TaxID=390896 RepID=A0A6A6HW27_9PLEO|nr:uncharacterized protein BU26DRAFT_555820 [Trematosphaeria pertusa]KAF2242119.1 hypothetical protein BU26DRAFT_555820 [Trematosphaeria pertusa]
MKGSNVLRASKDSMMRFDPSTFLTVRVGEAPNDENFLLHEGIICSRSEFFRRAMNGNWIEKEERLVKLPRDKPELFSIYVNLVYTNKLTTTPKTSAGKAPSVAAIGQEYQTMCELYVLCEKLQDTSAKDATVTAILSMIHVRHNRGGYRGPPPRAVRTIYEGTTSNSPARRLMVDLWTSVTASTLAKVAGSLPHEFIVDIATTLLNERTEGKQNTAKNSNGTKYLESMQEGNSTGY